MASDVVTLLPDPSLPQNRPQHSDAPATALWLPHYEGEMLTLFPANCSSSNMLHFMNEENVILHLNCVTWSGEFSYFIAAQRCRNPSRKLKKSIDRQIRRCLLSGPIAQL